MSFFSKNDTIIGNALYNVFVVPMQPRVIAKFQNKFPVPRKFLKKSPNKNARQK